MLVLPIKAKWYDMILSGGEEGGISHLFPVLDKTLLQLRNDEFGSQHERRILQGAALYA